MLKQLVRFGFSALGYDVVAAGCGARLALNDGLRPILDGIDLVIDVGANLGQYRDLLRRELGYDGLILSFEPHPEVFSQLVRRRGGDTLWHLDGRAVGSEAGTMTLNLAASTDMSSFHQPIAGSTPWNDTKMVGTAEVEVVTLDQLPQSVGLQFNERRKLLKIDTQGHDLEVIRGGAESLSRYEAIQMELSQIPLYADTPSMTETIDELKARGFLLSAAAPVSMHNGAAVEFDCLFVRART